MLRLPWFESTVSNVRWGKGSFVGKLPPDKRSKRKSARPLGRSSSDPSTFEVSYGPTDQLERGLEIDEVALCCREWKLVYRSPNRVHQTAIW